MANVWDAAAHAGFEIGTKNTDGNNFIACVDEVDLTDKLTKFAEYVEKKAKTPSSERKTKTSIYSEVYNIIASMTPPMVGNPEVQQVLQKIQNKYHEALSG